MVFTSFFLSLSVNIHYVYKVKYVGEYRNEGGNVEQVRQKKSVRNDIKSQSSLWLFLTLRTHTFYIISESRHLSSFIFSLFLFLLLLFYFPLTHLLTALLHLQRIYMEKISTNPLPVGTNNNKNKNNNNMLSGIGSSTNTKENNNVLDLNFDGMPKLNESSVRAVPLRANFKKSNTCGSLFAKCKCENHSHHHPTLIPLIDESVFERLKSEQNRRKTHSFSHPDTPIVFTEENRYPATTTADLLNRLRGATTHETVVRSGNRKLEIKHSKRSSSPNLIGDYSNVLDIHPEFKVKVAPKSPVKQAEIVRPILKKSSRSFPFTTQHSSPSLRSLDSYCYDTTREEIELSGKVSDSLVINDLDASAKSSPTSTADITKRTTTTVADIHNTTAEEEEEEGEETEAAVAEGSECKAKAPLSPSNSKDFSDEKFLQVSITHVPFALPHSQ